MERTVALALLGLRDEHPTAAQISEAYRFAIQMNHPDKYTHNDKLRQHAEEQCRLINEARVCLLQGVWTSESHNNETHDEETDWTKNSSSSSESEYARQERSYKADSNRTTDHQSRGRGSARTVDTRTNDEFDEASDDAFDRPYRETPLLSTWRTSVGRAIAYEIPGIPIAAET
jgi:curved DNA-binding protein CbpA